LTLRLDDFIQDLPWTKLLYLENSYLTRFNATVLRAELEGRRSIYLVLDSTAFHPKSGGQPSDMGILTGPGFSVSVRKVMVLHNVVVHFGVAEGSLNAQVSGAIDWKTRFLYMRRHTAGHLLDHCLGTVTGTAVETSDSWLGEGCYVAYRGRAPPEHVITQAVELENRMIPRGGAVRIEEVSREELVRRAPNAPNLHRLPPLERYRVVTIEGCNPIPCAGTHLRDIREIGGIRLDTVEQLEMDFRIYYDVEGSPTA